MNQPNQLCYRTRLANSANDLEKAATELRTRGALTTATIAENSAELNRTALTAAPRGMHVLRVYRFSQYGVSVAGPESRVRQFVAGILALAKDKPPLTYQLQIKPGGTADPATEIVICIQGIPEWVTAILPSIGQEWHTYTAYE